MARCFLFHFIVFRFEKTIKHPITKASTFVFNVICYLIIVIITMKVTIVYIHTLNKKVYLHHIDLIVDILYYCTHRLITCLGYYKKKSYTEPQKNFVVHTGDHQQTTSTHNHACITQYQLSRCICLLHTKSTINSTSKSPNLGNILYSTCISYC